MRARRIALHQSLPYRPGLRARKRNQALIQFLEPGPFDDGLRLDHILRVGPRQQFRQIQVTLRVLHQHHDA